jgi:hypothetical protein
MLSSKKLRPNPLKCKSPSLKHHIIYKLNYRNKPEKTGWYDVSTNIDLFVTSPEDRGGDQNFILNPIGPGGGCVTPPQSTYFLIRTFIQNKIIWKSNDFS